MREVICVCLADENGNERYQKLLWQLKTEHGIFLEGEESVDYLISLKEKENTAVIFLISVDSTGINLSLDSVLKKIASVPGCLHGMSAGMIVTGEGELYTKALARKTAFILNQAGCIIHGKAFAEATGSLCNMKNQAAYRNVTLEEAFFACAKEAIANASKAVDSITVKGIRHLTCIHSSIEEKSNTYAYWKLIREQLYRLQKDMEICELNLYGEKIEDCRGCSFETCQSFGKQKKCFFGGVMIEKVYPAIAKSDAIILLCPNYNDAIGANLCACINRLTALYRNSDFSGKYLYAVVVSGYSGGELLAEQVIDAMVLNKCFTLPKYAVDLHRANLPAEILKEEGIYEKAFAFAKRIVKDA